MELIINILAAVMLSDFLTNVIDLKIRLQRAFKTNRSLKPLGCMYCTAAWCALILFFFPHAAMIILVMLGSGYATKYVK